ncbi:MAG TPA: hypothetical protein OIL97_04380 [Oscillospiraceae bacterium]|jgi:hypothetical protein|nr:hypothetical protein [Oscillospiraceae bacterium]
MIDCKKTENYFKERKRMCDRSGCNGCPLSSYLNGTNKTCRVFENCYPNKAMVIVQKWSNEHPPKTLLTEFLKDYPNAKMNDDGFPSDIVPCSLGLIERKDICKNRCLYFYDKGRPCYDCWNTLIKGETDND